MREENVLILIIIICMLSFINNVILGCTTYHIAASALESENKKLTSS